MDRPSRLLKSTETKLRKHGSLESNDHLIEVCEGRLEYSTYDGTAHAHLSLTARYRPCSFSARRLFFGWDGWIAAELAHVWYIDTRGSEMVVAYSSPEFNILRWRWAASKSDGDGFAARLRAQRDQRLATLPEGVVGTHFDIANGEFVDPRVQGAVEDGWAGPWQPKK